MPVSMSALADDLAAESAVLRALLVPLDEDGWRQPTPAAGWSVLDQVTHLAWFDEAARALGAAAGGVRGRAGRTRTPTGWPRRTATGRAPSVLAWFDDARSRLVAAFRGLDPALRVPWYGPPMSAASALTARIMETWAHGQDVADALGVRREPTARLRHVAHIGIGARAYSYVVNGKHAAAGADPGGARRARRRHVDLGARTTPPTGSSGPRWTSASPSRNAAISPTRRWQVERAGRDRVDELRPGVRRARRSRSCAENIARATFSAHEREAPGPHRQLLRLLRRPARRGPRDGRRRPDRRPHAATTSPSSPC